MITTPHTVYLNTITVLSKWPKSRLGNTTKMIIDPNKIANIDSKFHLGQKWLLWSNDDSINKYDKLAERAQLYGNLTDVYHNQLLSDQDTLICVNSLLENERYHDLCDMTNARTCRRSFGRKNSD
jgi:hypothetical protein